MSVRGIFTINSRTFAVAQRVLSEVFSTFTQVPRGLVSNDSQIVSFAASAQQMIIASGGTMYLLDLTTNILSTIPASNFTGPVSQVGYSDGFFLALIANSNRFYVSGVLDATDWTSNGASLVSVFPDNLVSMLVDHRQIWFWSKTKAIAYYNSGAAQFPFDPVPSGFIEQGCAAKNSPARLDNTIFWLGSDDRGHAIVWRATGYTPSRVSNHAIEYAFQQYARIDDAIGYAFQDQGHSFYHLYFPSAGKSWRYDVATNMWHEVGFWNVKYGFFEAHHTQCHTFNFNKHLVGDWSSNKIYDMEIPRWNNGVWDFATDDGDWIRRVRRAAHISDEQKYATHHQVQIYLETGLGPIPPLPGTAAPTNIYLADTLGAIWDMQVRDTGVLETTSSLVPGTSQTLFFNDSDTGTTSWQVTVNTLGVLSTTSVPFSASYQKILKMVSDSGTTMWNLYVNSLGVLITSPGGAIYRDPMVALRWSNDAAHTWSNEIQIPAGKAGEFTKRVMARRLGRSRDRVYEISMNDPIPWRIIAGYAEIASSGDRR
jgi:hypothetical protein